MIRRVMFGNGLAPNTRLRIMAMKTPALRGVQDKSWTPKTYTTDFLVFLPAWEHRRVVTRKKRKLPQVL
jgi:hypothetical protein